MILAFLAYVYLQKQRGRMPSLFLSKPTEAATVL